MADAMDMFCQGVDGEMFDRPGTPWPEADITIVDLATFAREGYNAQLSIAYISLINTSTTSPSATSSSAGRSST